jgi:dihydroorotate dehydrogenase
LFLAFSYLYVTDTRASIHQYLSVPTLRYLYPDAEDAHHFGTRALKALYSLGIHPRERATPKSKRGKETDIGVEVFGQRLLNPIGTSAGIDKLAEVPDALFALGPAIVEVGGTTPFKQDGNPKPRVFRLPGQNSLINRYGLNSLGADDMARRLRERVRIFAKTRGYDSENVVLSGQAGVPPGSLQEGKLLAVQVAKNKNTNDSDIEAVRRDYVYCVERLAPYADILVVNVSSPNTPGLRTLQQVEPLTRILEGVVGAARAVKRANASSPKVMVKVSPDEDQDAQLEGIVEAIWKSGVDGVIVGNTTKSRKLPANSVLSEQERVTLKEDGGLSGPHMFERTLSLVKRYRKLLDAGPPPPEPEQQASEDSKETSPASAITASLSSAKDSIVSAVTGSKHNNEPKVIFATGGITNGKQALEVLNAGASVAQIYTALIYGGVGTITRIKKEMRQEIDSGKAK